MDSPIYPLGQAGLGTRNYGKLMLRKRIRSATVSGIFMGAIVVGSPFVLGQQSSGQPLGKTPAPPREKAGALMLGTAESSNVPMLILGDPEKGSLPATGLLSRKTPEALKLDSTGGSGEPRTRPVPSSPLQFGEDDEDYVSFARPAKTPVTSPRNVHVAGSHIAGSNGSVGPKASTPGAKVAARTVGMSQSDQPFVLQLSNADGGQVSPLPKKNASSLLLGVPANDSKSNTSVEMNDPVSALGSDEELLDEELLKESLGEDAMDITATSMASAPPETPVLPVARRPLPTGPISQPIDVERQFATSQRHETPVEDHAENVESSGAVVQSDDANSGDAANTEMTDEEDVGLPPVDPQLVEDVRDESELPQDETLVKRPRPVRIPFSMDEINRESSGNLNASLVNTKGASGKVRGAGQLELDDEKHQEEPAIDSRSSHSGREDQGVDALRATKPGKHIRGDTDDAGKATNNSLAPIVSKGISEGVTQSDTQRLIRTAACLDYYLSHPESTSGRSPWAVMHALIAFGPDYELQHGNSRVNAIGWMCHNGTCRTQRMFTPRGRSFVPNVGAGVQGHEGQFLAILAQSNVPLDYPIQIGREKFTVEDLVRYEMATCKEKSELTFKLIGLSYYLDSNKQWRANDGKVWSIPKLIQEELAQPVVGAACGGTHRLMGFSFSVKQRAMQGQPINGQFARADQFVKGYIDYTWRLQNPDGSFSTSWYEGRGNEPNDERKVQTTGHMLEWLMYTLPDSEINQPRVQKSIDFLLGHIYDNKENKWPIGPRGHATRSIALYQARYREIQQASPALLRSTSNTAAKTAPFSRR